MEFRKFTSVFSFVVVTEILFIAELMSAIKKDFGCLETMKDKLSAKTIAIQGSGWGWLAYDKEMKRLQLACCPNQDLLQPTTGKQHNKNKVGIFL